jgi:hypothetical protein
MTFGIIAIEVNRPGILNVLLRAINVMEFIPFFIIFQCNPT